MNSATSAPTDGASPADSPPPVAAVRGGTLLTFLAFCLAGLAAGLWPDSIYPSRADVPAAPLPTLQCLLIAQVAFIFLAYPILLQRSGRKRRFDEPGEETTGVETSRERKRPGSLSSPIQVNGVIPCSAKASQGKNAMTPAPGKNTATPAPGFWRNAIIESAVCMAAAGPFYFIGAWLGDASAIDALRAGMYVVCLWPAAWVATAYLERTDARVAAFLVMMVAAFGLPAGWYIAAEFVSVDKAQWLWNLGPATFVWNLARGRAGGIWPDPLWAWLVWPAVELATGLTLVLLPKRAGD